MTFICAQCGQGEHNRCRGGNWCDCKHRLIDGVIVERTIEQWRVTDQAGETASLSSYREVADSVAATLDGSTVWYRQVRHVRTPWRMVEEIHLPVAGG